MADIIAISYGGKYEELPPPSSYSVIDKPIYAQNERNVNFKMITELGAVKKQISMTWRTLAPSDFIRICRLTEGDPLMVTCYDPQTGEYYSGEFLRDNTYKYGIDATTGMWDGGPRWIQSATVVLTEK